MVFGKPKQSGSAKGGGNADARRPAQPQGGTKAARQGQAASKQSKPAKQKQGNQRLELCRICDKTSKDSLDKRRSYRKTLKLFRSGLLNASM